MNLTLEQWALLLTAIAAWVALGISLYNLLQGRPRRRVEASLVFIGRPTTSQKVVIDPRTSQEAILITFINERGPVVVIEQVGFECADGRDAVFLRPYGDPLPSTVSPGHNAKWYVELKPRESDIQERESIPERAYCQDATGHRHKTSLNPEITSALSGKELVERTLSFG